MNETGGHGHLLFAMCCIDVVLMKSAKIRESGMEKKMFLKEFKDRLLTLYKQEWVTSLRTNDPIFSAFRLNLSFLPYLNDLKHVNSSNFLITIRLVVSTLKTHKLRFASNTMQADLACPFCRSNSDTEIKKF